MGMTAFGKVPEYMAIASKARWKRTKAAVIRMAGCSVTSQNSFPFFNYRYCLVFSGALRLLVGQLQSSRVSALGVF